nr:RNA-directed DNA polymerase, eukaryota, reverse transcriptase zinc-binding domain protein [Tanacetum cinerariifolium]
SIRGILVEGTWIDSPSLVKSEFLLHFKNRFEQPNSNRLHMNMHFSNTLSSVQVADLECQVSKEEIKKAVWDCGIDKPLGPDGFTFGSKVAGCMSRIQSWNETIERMACRLSKWKLKTLSIRGRLILLKFVLGSIPIYHMSLFKVPKKVLYRMESMRSYFFNGAELSSKKSVWMKWKHALASKDKSGLGVSSLFALNRALMFKWVWRFITQGEVLLSLVMADINHDVEMFKSRGIDLVSLIHSKFGNRANTSFWEVAWSGGSPFKSPFPRLYALETQKKIDVGLDVLFRHHPRGGVEIQQFEHMKEKVEGCIPADMMDRWFWALEGSGEFTITSVRKMIDDFMLPEVSSKKRWIKVVPIKVNVHA